MPKWIKGEKAVGDCIISKHSTVKTRANGLYPIAVHLGRAVGHHRLVYCLANNVSWKDIKGMQILHLCDNRQCVNKDHLRLGSHDNNMQDMVDRNRSAKNHGELGSNSKLTEADVLAIRADKKHTQVELAVKFGVNRPAISKILLRTTWKHI